MVVHPALAPLRPHDLRLVKVELVGSFLLVNMVPPPPLLHQVLDEHMIIPKPNLIPVDLSLLVHNHFLIYVLFASVLGHL
jgi:hypothetical protein